MANFLDTIYEWTENVETKVDDILQTIVFKIGESVVNLSPVDTGRFKGNWQLTIDERASASLLRYDQDGHTTLAAIAAKANSFTAGQVAYIQNMVLYGYDLEYGYSKQAPDGMVRITALQFQQIVDEAIRLHT